MAFVLAMISDPKFDPKVGLSQAESTGVPVKFSPQEKGVHLNPFAAVKASERACPKELQRVDDLCLQPPKPPPQKKKASLLIADSLDQHI